MNTSFFQGRLVDTKRILYTPSAFAKSNLIYLQEVGTLIAKKPHKSQRSNLSSYLFFVVVDGSGILDYNGVSYSLTQGDCVFINCQKPYLQQSSHNNLWTLKWTHFYGSNMSAIYEKYAERGGQPTFHPEEILEYCRLIDDIYDIANSNNYIKDMKIFEKLSSLLVLLMENSWNPTSDIHTKIPKYDLQPIKSYLDLHYTEKITLDYLSETFFINKFYLSRLFKQQYGISLNSYLLEIRITHAKQLLRFSTLTIEDIGQKCGMCDANYFSRMFKRIEGISPSDYRKQW